MWNAVWAIAWKDIYTTFRDRSTLLIMFATPLVLSTIIGFAFGGIGGSAGDLPTTDLAIVNLDTGADVNGATLNYGDIFVDVFSPSQGDGTGGIGDQPACELLAPDPNNAAASNGTFDITKLIHATTYDSAEAARAAVDAGDIQVALILPADFTKTLQVSGTDMTLGQTQLEIYGSPAYPVSVSIIQSISRNVASQISNGSVTIAATIKALIARSVSDPAFALRWTAAQATGQFKPDFGCAFIPDLSIVSVDRQPLNASQTQSAFVMILVAIGSAQAVYFALFTAQFGILSIYDEKKQGTLDRIMAAPVARSSILVGKLIGSFVIVVMQLSLLMLALTLIASLLEGTPQFIWGPYPLLVFLTILVIAVSVSGIGVFVVGLARTAEQVNIVGPVLYSTMGALGGAFGFQLPVINQLSPIFWGTNALVKLTSGNLDIGLNLIILLVQGAVMFVIGSRLFARRTGL